MYYGKIHIKSIEEARSFVAMTAKYPGLKLMLESNEYQVDAHSIIGILSLDFSQPMTLSVEGEHIEEFLDDLQPYTVV